MKIYIDADACPVKDIVMQTAEKYDIRVVLIFSTSHYGNSLSFEKAEKIMVDNESQAVDMAIMNKVRDGDLVVTGDFGLAALVLGKGAEAISFSGRIFYVEEIDRLLFERHMTLQIRKSGGRIKGPAKRNKQDDARFEENLRYLILKSMKDI